MVIDYIEDRCSKENLETTGLLLLSKNVLDEARGFGEPIADGVYVEVSPGLFQTEAEYRGNMEFDEHRDNQ